MTVLNKTPTKTYHCTVPLHHAAAMGWGWRHDWASCTGKSAAERRSSSQRARTSASRPSHTQDLARPMAIPPSQHEPLICRQILGYLLAVLCLHVRPQNIAPSLVPPQRRRGKVASARRRAVALHLHLIASAVVASAGAARLLLLLVVVVIGGVGCRLVLQAGLVRVEDIGRDVLGGLPSHRVGREVF